MYPPLLHVEDILSDEVRIPVDGGVVGGTLSVPQFADERTSPRGVVVFAHGSGSSRFSPRNRYVAQVLQGAGFATLLMDLLTPKEEALDMRTAELRFDIDLLARRLVTATEWLRFEPRTHGLNFGYFGASTGAAAALVAAATSPDGIDAVVSRGGRPDLAGAALPQVRAATLLIVGGIDPVVLELNEQALEGLCCEKQLRVIPGATHLFEEPGALEAAAALARDWFDAHMKGSMVSQPSRAV